MILDFTVGEKAQGVWRTPLRHGMLLRPLYADNTCYFIYLMYMCLVYSIWTGHRHTTFYSFFITLFWNSFVSLTS